MRRLLSILIVLTIIISGFYINAEKENVITFEKAKLELIKNNRTLKKLDYIQRKAQLQYNKAVIASKNIDISGLKEELAKFFMKLDKYDEMLMIMQRDFFPKQMKYYWLSSYDNKIITEKSLIIGLRDLYLALYNAKFDINIKQEKLNLAKEKYNQDKTKYMQGLITENELEEVNYSLQKAEKELIIAKRDLENITRSLNSYIGVPLNTTYDEVIFKENLRYMDLKPVEYYIEKALNERLEIKNLEKQIELKELEKSILEKNDVHKIYTQARKDHENVVRDIQNLNLKLEKAKYEIENEIKTAYIDIKKEVNNLNNLQRMLQLQKRKLKALKSQYYQGMIPKIYIKELEISIKEMENSLKIIKYNYNTKMLKLEYASGIGPAYGKVGVR
ncbi:hypothetical protein TR13x_04975 [Caloranaerobacter sp. TR13]|uniref:TolC family protein n=1 Tax=Caloranaerobacter sp. TR13 TaxID=1302151 RepID=UPI0006D48063|nr:TolC family protein [Caloranaerobacter sp. TR13]KPU27426.1 hypothetical protein TR13x_04975 [Caloranaerobacter sp. TR13]